MLLNRIFGGAGDVGRGGVETLRDRQKQDAACIDCVCLGKEAE